MTSTQLDWTNEGVASPVPAADAAPGTIWDGPRARARIALLVNVFLLVWVIGSALDVADSAWVFSGSRALTIPSLVVSGFFWVLLLPAFLLGVGYSPWLPRRSLGWLLGAGIVVGFSTDPFFSVTPEPEESGLMPLLRSWIYWPVEDALVLYFSQSLQLVIGIAGYWMLRRQCGVSGYYLDAQSLAAAEKPFRNEARAGAGAVSWRLWDGPHARARIAVFINAFLLVWVVGATLGAANSALVLATESRVLGPLSFATGVFSWTLLPPFLLVMSLSPWLPRRTLGWLLVAGLAVGFSVLPFLSETDPGAELTLASAIYWPIADARPMLFSQFLQLVIVVAGYWVLRRQCGISGYYLDAQSLATAEKPGRTFLEVLADTRQGYLAYLGKAFVIDMVPTFVLIAVFVLPIMFFDPFPPAEMPTADAVESFEAVWLILLAPIYETLLLWVALVVVRWAIGDRPLATAAWVGLLCGLAHLTNSVLNFVVFWGFFVQALAFMAWEKHSWWKAFAMVATLHALYNAFLFPVIAGAGQ